MAIKRLHLRCSTRQFWLAGAGDLDFAAMSDVHAAPPPARSLVWGRYACFAIGIAIGLAMVMRSRVTGDQVKLLWLGWAWFGDNILPPFGTGMSHGGVTPGSLTGIFVGGPMFLWADHRAASLFILVLHVIGYLFLDRALRTTLSPRERLLLVVFYWLNPWRLYHSGHLWNPNWLFFFMGLYVWTCWRMRTQQSFWLSFIHVFGVGLVFQLHGSFLMMAIFSVLLFWRRYIKVSWWGVGAAILVTLLTLIPWMLEVLAHPELAPAQAGFVGRGLVYVYPLLRGILYWLRYPSMHVASLMADTDFAPDFGLEADAVLEPVFFTLARVIGSASVVLSLLAAVWFYRNSKTPGFAAAKPEADARTWWFGFIRWMFVASAITFALSPQTVMYFHAFLILPVAVLPLVFWASNRLDAPRYTWLRPVLYAYPVLAILLSLGMLGGSPHYRSGSEASLEDIEHPMVQTLGMDRNQTITPFDPMTGGIKYFIYVKDWRERNGLK